MLINSVNNKKVKEWKKLKEKKYRKQESLFLIEGLHGAKEAYKTNNLKEIIILEENNIELNVEKHNVNEKIMKELSSFKSIPKVIGVARIDNKTEIEGEKFLLLDNVQDPGNMGTIIRSAVAFGIDSIIIEDSCDPYNEKVISATQGLIFKINILEKSLKETIDLLKNKNIKIIGTDVENGEDLKQKKEDSYALIVGNEGQGVRKELLNLCDDVINIKIKKEVESLNVGVASSIIMYQLGE